MKERVPKSNRMKYLFQLACRNLQKASKFQSSFTGLFIAKASEKLKTYFKQKAVRLT